MHEIRQKHNTLDVILQLLNQLDVDIRHQQGPRNLLQHRRQYLLIYRVRGYRESNQITITGLNTKSKEMIYSLSSVAVWHLQQSQHTLHTSD
jgi:hypothetical protein